MIDSKQENCRVLEEIGVMADLIRAGIRFLLPGEGNKLPSSRQQSRVGKIKDLCLQGYDNIKKRSPLCSP